MPGCGNPMVTFSWSFFEVWRIRHYDIIVRIHLEFLNRLMVTNHSRMEGTVSKVIHGLLCTRSMNFNSIDKSFLKTLRKLKRNDSATRSYIQYSLDGIHSCI